MELDFVENVGILASHVSEVAWEGIERDRGANFWLSVEAATGAITMLQGHGLRVGQWDKAIFTLSAICKVLDDRHICESVIFGDQFSLWGWAVTPIRATASVVLYIVDKAYNFGVLEDAWDSWK